MVLRTVSRGEVCALLLVPRPTFYRRALAHPSFSHALRVLLQHFLIQAKISLSLSLSLAHFTYPLFLIFISLGKLSTGLKVARGSTVME